MGSGICNLGIMFKMSFIDFLLGREPSASDDGILKKYIDSLSVRSDYIKIEGPFLNSQYALRYADLYKELLKNSFYRINLSINRPLVLISADKTLETMDNNRVKLGIIPFNHRFDLHMTVSDFTVIGVDGNIFLNRDDRIRAKGALERFPITRQEEEQLRIDRMRRGF